MVVYNITIAFYQQENVNEYRQFTSFTHFYIFIWRQRHSMGQGFRKRINNRFQLQRRDQSQ